MWDIGTDRGDTMKARFVICANGTLSKPKLARIAGMERYKGFSFHTSRWDYDFTGPNLENLHDKVVGIIGTGASAVQIIPSSASRPRSSTSSSARRRPSTSRTTGRPIPSGRRS